MLRRLLYTAGLVVLLLVVPLRFSDALRSSALRAVSKVARPLTSANRSIGNSLISLRQIPSLLQERLQLQNQVVQLQQQLLQLDQINQENAALRKELGVTGISQQSPKTLAHVVVLGNDPVDRTVIIDVGSSQGVAVGQPAVYEGALIGRVVQINSRNATVRLVTSTHSLLQTRIASDQQKGLLTGTGNGVQLTDVQQGISPAANSSVETSGLGGSLPGGILVGTLGAMLSKPSNPSQSFMVSLPYDPSSVPAFFILLTTTDS